MAPSKGDKLSEVEPRHLVLDLTPPAKAGAAPATLELHAYLPVAAGPPEAWLCNGYPFEPPRLLVVRFALLGFQAN